MSDHLHQWQPIETAPRDGTRVLVSCVYPVQCELFSHEWLDWWDIDKERWAEYPSEIPAPFPPTHWMLMPAPPTEPEDQKAALSHVETVARDYRESKDRTPPKFKQWHRRYDEALKALDRVRELIEQGTK